MVITKLHDRFAETIQDDEIILVRLDNGDMFSLTDSGAAIWRLIDTHPDRNGLVGALATEFGVPKDNVRDDVDRFLTQLTQSGFLAEA